MKLKKIIATVTIGAVMLGSLTACGSKSDSTTAATEAATSAEESSAASSGNGFVSINGTDLALDMNWNDVKDKLGSETKPADTIQPCDGGDYIQIMHHFDGITVTTLRDETIIGLEPAEGSTEVLVMGKVKKGDNLETIKSALGTPSSESDGMLVYNAGNASVMLYLDNDALTSFAFMKAQ